MRRAYLLLASCVVVALLAADPPVAAVVRGTIKARPIDPLDIGWPGTVLIDNPAARPLLVSNPSGDKLQFIRTFNDDPAVMSFIVFGRVPGDYTIELIGNSDDPKKPPVKVETVMVKVKGKLPDVDPDVKPDPNPPAPTPPAPIPGDGLRVMAFYESGKLLPAQQYSAMFGEKVRSYLQSKCPTGPDGKTKEYRFFDQHSDLKNEATIWQDAMKRPRASVPWIIVSNGKAGEEVPYPANESETLKLLKKYGGE